jgi:hypothetical protein
MAQDTTIAKSEAGTATLSWESPETPFLQDAAAISGAATATGISTASTANADG